MIKSTTILIACFLFVLSQIVSSQTVAEKLQNAFIWSNEKDVKGAFTVFRKSFETSKPELATLNMFADARYILWINGEEIQRGPCRFDPKGPQYDISDVTSYMKEGKNTIAVLVMAIGSNGKMMKHDPGLTLSLSLKNGAKTSEITTNETWLWNNKTRYLPARQTWGFICDNIDARLDDGDWVTTAYDDSKWQQSFKIDGLKWGRLTPRAIPMLGKWDIPARLLNGKPFPCDIDTGKSVIVELDRMIQGYANFDFETTKGAKLEFKVGYTTDSSEIITKYGTTNTYIAKQGRQNYITTESYGFRYIKISAKNAPLKLYGIKTTDYRYPYANAGRFSCNDSSLNEIWKRAALTILMNAEDGYMDCALREKAEWLGDAAVVEYPVSRVLFGYAPDGKNIRSDAGLMKNMIRHIAQSRTDSGTLKAHHPSDRWDIHGYIEDYSCLWVQSLRQVYDYTGDADLVREVWEPLKGQMAWFLKYRSVNGLLNAREFVIFDNPLVYITCEGATLNAFLYKALVDAAYLAEVVKDKASAKLYSTAANELYTNFNKQLWIEEKQTYSSGLSNGKKLLPTAHAAMLALYMGIVPADRKQKVETYMFSNFTNRGKKTKIKEKNVLQEVAFDINAEANGISMPYTAFWALTNLYNANRDTLALNFIRDKWASSLKIKQTGTFTESFGGGDLCHNFGASAAYFLSANVLGVTTLLPMKDNCVQIKPQLADLKHAEGSVVTEHGVVDVSWTHDNNKISFTLKIPEGKKALLILPVNSAKPQLTINEKIQKTKLIGAWLNVELPSGTYSGSLQ